jgi:hypothetical protein
MTTLDGRPQAGGKGRRNGPLGEFPKLKADLVRKLKACTLCRQKKVSVRGTPLTYVMCLLLADLRHSSAPTSTGTGSRTHIRNRYWDESTPLRP